MKGRGWGFLVWGFLWTIPCASLAGIAAAPLAPPPPHHTIPDVPFYPLPARDHGPASVASVLSFWGESVRAEDLDAAQSPLGSSGSPLTEMEQTARGRGLGVWAYRGGLADLRNHVSLGHPLVAYLDLGGADTSDGEFVVVTGYSDPDRKVFAHSLGRPNQKVSYDRFVDGWAKSGFWTLLILPKDYKTTDEFMGNQPH